MAGIGVVGLVIMMGGDLHMFVSEHAFIVIFGGSFAATLIRFPFSSFVHGVPLGAKFAFTLRRTTQRELVDELAALAEVARKSGPIGLEKVEIDDPFLAKGIRFVADGYDTSFIRDNLERDRDNFLTHLDEGQKIYRAGGAQATVHLDDEQRMAAQFEEVVPGIDGLHAQHRGPEGCQPPLDVAAKYAGIRPMRAEELLRGSPF